MEDITRFVASYLEAKRHLWNTYFLHNFKSIRDCSTLDDFEEIDRLLFSALILRKIGKTLPIDFVYGKEEINFLQVVPNNGFGSMSLMITDDSVCSYTKWDRPVEVKIDQGIKFSYIELFEWDRYNFVSYPYYMAKIVASENQKEFLGRNVLIETAYSKIFFTP